MAAPTRGSGAKAGLVVKVAARWPDKGAKGREGERKGSGVHSEAEEKRDADMVKARGTVTAPLAMAAATPPPRAATRRLRLLFLDAAWPPRLLLFFPLLFLSSSSSFPPFSSPISPSGGGSGRPRMDGRGLPAGVFVALDRG